MDVRKNPYKFYMQKIDKNGNAIEDKPKDLEKDFDGLRYTRCDGLDKIGTPKNIYTEDYSDADRLRVHIPENVTNSETEITLTLYFFGLDRRKVYNDFCEYIRQGFTRYWDDAREKYFDFYIAKDIDTANEQWYGNIPYLNAEFKLQNIYGKTFDVDW